jgi:hypothetical protein
MTEDEREHAMLTLLEGRRLAFDSYMWQAPTLTLVVQAFLLGVLTDKGVGWTVATSVAVAGVFACLTAMFALLLLHDRELHFSRRIARHTVALGLEDPRRTTDRRKRHWLEWKGWWLWEGVLAAFIVADLLALIVTRY